MSANEETSHLFQKVKEPTADELEFHPKWLNRSDLPSFSPTAGATMQPFDGGKLMMIWVTIEPNVDYPHHQHPHEQMGVIEVVATGRHVRDSTLPSAQGQNA
jgi:hypothetical protein